MDRPTELNKMERSKNILILKKTASHHSNSTKLPKLNNSNVSCNYLKLVFALFYQIFIFSPKDSPLETMRNIFYFI